MDTMLIGMVVHEHAVASGVFALTEILIAANRLTKRSCFAVRFAAIQPSRQTLCIGGGGLAATVDATHSLSSKSIDCLVLPGLWDRYGQELDSFVAHHASLVDAIGALPQHRQILGYCTSVCLLAAARRLDGLEATATWWLAKSLQQSYCDVSWQFDQSTVFTDTVGTVSGGNGYLKIAQRLIEQELGANTWRELSELLLIPVPASRNEPFADLRLSNDKSSYVQKLHTWAKQTPAAAITPEAAANVVGRSTRTVSRRLQAEIGLTLGRFLCSVKLIQACDLLKNSSLTVEAVADELGYNDATTLRRAFRRETRLSPLEFRSSFGQARIGETHLP